MDLTITTYGGGDILYAIFTAIAKLSNKSGGILYPMFAVFATVGLFIAISKAFFSQSPDYFFKKYFIPIFLTSYILMLPTSSVYIEDLLTQEGNSVNGVPFVLAKTASLISSIGYRMTKAFELVLHTPGDERYNSTGMIFGSDTYLDAKTFKIRNADLEYNLKNICKNCILYDLALNKYSFDDLKKSQNLWEFIKSNTSKSRMINYYNLKDSDETYMSCIDAMQKLDPLFNQEKAYFLKQEIIKNLPLRYQALTGMQIEADNLISQQLMYGVLKDGLKGTKFAESRAYTQQRSNYQIIGSLAGTSLVTMRAVFEALIYMSFILIVPLTLIPGGYAFAKNWAWMAGWIQLWPPFYAILNFIMHVVTKSRAESIFVGNSLCYIDQMGLENFYSDVHALSGYLMLSVPFISYAILKGGVQSLIHMAGSMMSPAYSAASGASGELTSGNYSYANISYGQNSFGNTTKLQKNTAPSLTHGFIQENRGTYSETYGEDCILDQRASNLRTSVISEESISKSLNDSYQNATSLSENSQKMYQESVSSHGRTSCDLINTLASSENYTSNISNSERDDYTASARKCQSIARNLSEQTGVDEHHTMQFLCNAGLNTGVFGGAQISDNQSAALHEAFNSASFASKNEDFQSSFQTLQDFATSRAHNTLNEEGIRKSDAFTQSVDDVSSSSEQYAASLSKLSQVSEQISLYQNNSDKLTKNLNQDFVDFSAERYGGFAMASDIIRKGPDCDRESLYTDFFNSQIAKYSIPMQTESLHANYAAMNVKSLDKDSEYANLFKQSAELESSDKLSRGHVGEMKMGMSSERDSFQYYRTDKQRKSFQNISTESQKLDQRYTSERSTPLADKVGASTIGKAIDLLTQSFKGSGINQNEPMWTAKDQ